VHVVSDIDCWQFKEKSHVGETINFVRVHVLPMKPSRRICIEFDLLSNSMILLHTSFTIPNLSATDLGFCSI